LVLRLSAPKAEATDDGVSKVDFDPGEPMGPVRRDWESVAEQADVTGLVTTSYINDGAGSEVPQVEVSGNRQGRAAGRCFSGTSTARTPSKREAIAGFLYRAQVWMQKSPPDFALPETVKVLDEVLKAGLGRWGEHRGNAQGQAEAGNLPKGIRPHMAPFKDRAVVELGIGGSAMFTPVPEEKLAGLGGGKARGSPSCSEGAPLGTGGEDLKERTILQAQVFDEVIAVQVDGAGDQPWQVPAQGWWRMPHPAGVDEQAFLCQHAPDGPDAGRGGSPTHLQLLVNRARPREPQRTLHEVVAQRHDGLSRFFGAPAGHSLRHMRPVRPIDVG
jgi:hypothetical protein